MYFDRMFKRLYHRNTIWAPFPEEVIWNWDYLLGWKGETKEQQKTQTQQMIVSQNGRDVYNYISTMALNVNIPKYSN